MSKTSETEEGERKRVRRCPKHRKQQRERERELGHVQNIGNNRGREKESWAMSRTSETAEGVRERESGHVQNIGNSRGTEKESRTVSKTSETIEGERKRVGPRPKHRKQ